MPSTQKIRLSPSNSTRSFFAFIPRPSVQYRLDTLRPLQQQHLYSTKGSLYLLLRSKSQRFFCYHSPPPLSVAPLAALRSFSVPCCQIVMEALYISLFFLVRVIMRVALSDVIDPASSSVFTMAVSAFALVDNGPSATRITPQNRRSFIETLRRSFSFPSSRYNLFSASMSLIQLIRQREYLKSLYTLPGRRLPRRNPRKLMK